MPAVCLPIALYTQGVRCILNMGLPDIESIPDTGAVFTLGKSRFADNIASHFFIRKDPVVSVNCGDEHSAVVCQSGRLFVFGSNNWGQLGLGHKNHVSKPSCVKSLKPEKVTHVACGRAHTLICTDNQKIFSCGSDQESQLGRGNVGLGDSSSTPVLVYDCGSSGKKILQIAAGTQHSLALTNDGMVLAWGSNLEGQLGLSGTSGLINKPTEVPMPEPIKQISAGYYHSAFLTESGSVYVCGETESGKLGIPLDFMTQVAPKQMQLNVSVINVACGGHHTLILGENGCIYGTGSNTNGQLGLGLDIQEIQTAQELTCDALKNENIIHISCGESHSAVVTESGKLFICGDGRYGKLGVEENDKNIYELTYTIKYQELFITNVACGGCHTILVGQRRESINNEEFNDMKTTALPPLKLLPTTRLENDISQTEIESSNYKDNEKEENEKNKIELSDKPMNGNSNIDDELENLKKPESPKNSSDYEESIPIESTKLTQDSMMSEKNNAINDNLSNLNTESTIDNKKDDERPKSSKSITQNVIEDEDVNEEKINENNIEESSIVEKPDCPPMSVEQEKTPRQNSGESKSSSHHSIAPSSTNESIKSITNNAEEKEPSIKSASNVNHEDDKKSINSHEINGHKKSAGSNKSQSNKSNANTDDTMPLETTAEKIVEKIESTIDKTVEKVEEKIDKTVEKVEEKIDTINHNVDIVGSTIAQAGVMAKIFKNKKQEVENIINTTISKPKSKTCNIL
ncbi:X-linked retinitis pigmentosa GTPase regulator isoform X2 [Aphidius gifuensis]|uniref:X-linked retinitis pigmentosa GTPase regulator isoform X2 n=1 Tax=Aphidius gifuensis TaxID=684658 RepID=UPI001CDBA73D|nr:X-linked retinitis pigmentosa GTPase regulator isoform X2 [Aphidius gifuensis]